MTSLLLLLLVTAMVQIQLLQSVVGATGFGQDMADDVIIFKGMSCNDIKNKNEDRRTQICKRKKVVRFSCPQTCDDVSIFKKECPSKITSSKFEQEKDCSKKYQHNRQCDYDYKYTGCTWDELQCTSQQGYTCDYESSTWNLATTIIEQCEDSPNDFPFYEECTPCSNSKPAKGCPKNAPTNQNDCSAFENDLTCDYNFMLTGCNRSALQCSPANSFTCSEGKQWEEVASIPAPCPIPSNKCPTNLSSPDFEKSCNPTYQDDLMCKYDFIFTGCNKGELQCTSQQWYSCDYGLPMWSHTTARLWLNCDNPELPVSQQCAWPELVSKEYREAEDIIRGTDPIGFITIIEKVVEETPVTPDHLWNRVRVVVDKQTENIIVSVPIVG
mmetsp:Transcript_58023/g.62705  ORF Transcript_58023/g.62705 Transcript_58023/m.62705 type:complete len:384 (+) Transcript_58023:294-1445(+)